MLKESKIKKYVFNYKVKIENKSVVTKAIVERNYVKTIKQNTTIVNDIYHNLFMNCYMRTNLHCRHMNTFVNKLIDRIKSSKILYNIEINYIYTKSKSNKSVFASLNHFYEININCYNEKNKVRFSRELKIKRLNYNQLEDEIFKYEDILLSNHIDKHEGVIDSKSIILSSYAFSQILSAYKKNLWEIRDKISPHNVIKIDNDNLDVKSFKFINRNSVDTLEDNLKNGYVITNVYFLNNPKENKNYIKVLCVGYYLNNYKIEKVFSNKILTFDFVKLLNGIKYVSEKHYFSNEFDCPAILTKL